MAPTGIAMDIGTSGIRAQAIDLSTREILSTAITTRHPLPGGNVIDHLHFSLELGVDISRSILIGAINRVIGELRIPVIGVERFAVCGNPVQLSLFTGDEIRDLAFAGKRKLDGLGVTAPRREARVLPASKIPGLCLPPGCRVIIPPAVSHEVGADALALILKSGMLREDECSIAIDYGTNAEMALLHGGTILTGSTAAGPALEGQQIHCGILAVPGAISDLQPEPPHHRIVQLDRDMLPVTSALIDLGTGTCHHPGDAGTPVGITGTGTIAALHEGMTSGLVRIPKILTPDHRLHLGDGIFLDEDDLAEAGKAIGAIRAGYQTLCHEAGIRPEEIRTIHMAGAAGTYMDAGKARQLGLVPPGVKTVFQWGNTSLAMARDLILDEPALSTMSSLASRLNGRYCLFASLPVFKTIYILEFSYWTEGMPMDLYRSLLAKHHLADLPPPSGNPQIHRMATRDIEEPGELGLVIIDDIGPVQRTVFSGCTSCSQCTGACPEHAVSLTGSEYGACLALDASRCLGVACRRCERACPEKVLKIHGFFRKGTEERTAESGTGA